MSYQQYPGGAYPTGGGYPNPGIPQPLPPRRPVWPWFVGAAVFVVLLSFGGCVYLGFEFFSGPSGAASSYTIDLENGDNLGAYDKLCVESKAEISFPAFQARYIPAKEIRNVDAGGDTPISESGGTSSFIAEFEYIDGTREDVLYGLVKEGTDWRVCNPAEPLN